jgi:hypothetical protein
LSLQQHKLKDHSTVIVDSFKQRLPPLPSTVDYIDNILFLKQIKPCAGASALDKRSKKKFDSALLAQLGSRPDKGMKIPASIAIGRVDTGSTY